MSDHHDKLVAAEYYLIDKWIPRYMAAVKNFRDMLEQLQAAADNLEECRNAVESCMSHYDTVVSECLPSVKTDLPSLDETMDEKLTRLFPERK